MAKEGFIKKNLSRGPIRKILRKSLIQYFVWSIVLYGVETQTRRNNTEAFEMWT